MAMVTSDHRYSKIGAWLFNAAPGSCLARGAYNSGLPDGAATRYRQAPSVWTEIDYGSDKARRRTPDLAADLLVALSSALRRFGL